jgi:hypothetical protein
MRQIGSRGVYVLETSLDPRCEHIEQSAMNRLRPGPDQDRIHAGHDLCLRGIHNEGCRNVSSSSPHACWSHGGDRRPQTLRTVQYRADGPSLLGWDVSPRARHDIGAISPGDCRSQASSHYNLYPIPEEHFDPSSIRNQPVGLSIARVIARKLFDGSVCRNGLNISPSKWPLDLRLRH